MLKDKVIVIVGASGGIGAALTEKLAFTESRLVLAARDESRLNTIASQSSTEVLVVPTDITQKQQVNTLMEKTLARFGQIDILINAAGVGVLKSYSNLESADLDLILDVNLKGSFYTTQLAAVHMQKRKSSHICNVVGILGKHSMGMTAAYSAFNLIVTCSFKFQLQNPPNLR
jgi:NADP-dependent 3-hydroxy acid dehydrogenase YdfG